MPALINLYSIWPSPGSEVSTQAQLGLRDFTPCVPFRTEYKRDTSLRGVGKMEYSGMNCPINFDSGNVKYIHTKEKIRGIDLP